VYVDIVTESLSRGNQTTVRWSKTAFFNVFGRCFFRNKARLAIKLLLH